MEVLDLSGRQWEVRKSGGGIKISAVVPGDVYADLIRAKKIRDPFFRDNEKKLQWIGESDWIYNRQFKVSPDFKNRKKVLLRCDGLDTFSEVRINGKKIASSNNMFRVWEWDVKRSLREGVNTIEILFRSTLPYIRKKQKQRRIPWWESEHIAACYGRVRKKACNYGWDWGIKAVTAGIWRPIKLLSYDVGRILDAQICQYHGGSGVKLRITMRTEGILPGMRLRAAVFYKGRKIQFLESAVSGERVKVELIVRNPKLWWPNNMGGQPLYGIVVDLLDAKGRKTDSLKKRIGLRVLKLDRRRDKRGESFRFMVNGIPFFAKGANWIPADAIQGRLKPDRYRKLVKAAADANMNMLRVWGGGIYEDDSFYDTCDEMGICVWQDFMFACSTYPVFEKGFLENVEEEAKDNIRRLRHHPCLALWCGNNEIEQGLVGKRWTKRTMSWKDYGRLFDSLLPLLVKDLDPQRDYWPGSPHSSLPPRSEFNNPSCGDAHLWEVWHGGKPFEWYRGSRHRFCSEFGFQSFPEPRTVRGYTNPKDRHIESRVMRHHQRSGNGNARIMRYMSGWFRSPKDFNMTLYLSQILQGMAMKYAVEHWRRCMPRTMGTLYWQLNDCWPVASWSSIDYHGRWKALHYMARKFYAPLIVTGVENSRKGSIDIFITNDLLEQARGILSWRVVDVEGKTLLKGSRRCGIGRGESRKMHALKLGELAAERGGEIVVYMEFRSGRWKSENLVTMVRPAELKLSNDPGITVTGRKKGAGEFEVVLSAKKPALWTWLEFKGAVFSDNFFHLVPGRPIRVHVETGKSVSADSFRRGLVVKSLVDTYGGRT